ncbi:MAG: DNA-directed RNA polymerase subunit H [Candidatus Bathyarchaeota archaeon]
MGKRISEVEKRARLIIKYRNFKVTKKEKEEDGDRVTYYLRRGDKKYILQTITNQRNVGIAFVRDLNKKLEKEEAEGGIIVTDVKFTYSSRHNAPRLGVELIPHTIPTFDLFKHELVPEAKILSEEEREDVLENYHSEPYQFPWIMSNDPVSIILGANAGDIIKFISESETAGTSVTYRYVA